MKKTLVYISLIVTCSSSLAASISNKSSPQSQLGYSYGYVLGRGNAEILKDVDLDAFTQGIKQGSAGQKASLTDEEMTKVLTVYKQQTDAQQLEIFKQVALKNNQLGGEFLTNNAKQPGVVRTASGLQYQVIEAGNGKKAQANSTVLVNYEGRLLDGTVFDSSIARNQPVEFKVSQVIQGWTEALQLMPEGAKYRLFIPAKLAYGEIGSGDAIEPNSTLIFDVELLKILP